MTAAAAWALQHAGVSCITAEMDKDNTASIRVLEKTGFLPTGEAGEEGPIYARRLPRRKEGK